jgi:IPTL-CTERM motif
LLITALGPTIGTQAGAGSVATTGGTLTFIAIPLTFQAIRNATIPTLNRWGLLLLGILLTGAAFFSLRHRIFSRRLIPHTDT